MFIRLSVKRRKSPQYPQEINTRAESKNMRWYPGVAVLVWTAATSLMWPVSILLLHPLPEGGPSGGFPHSPTLRTTVSRMALTINHNLGVQRHCITPS